MPRWTVRRALRAVGFTLALVASVGGATPSVSFSFGFGGGGGQPDACAAQRAPILERKRQYDALRRSQIASAVGEGLKKGALFFATAMLSRYSLGPLHLGGSGDDDKNNNGNAQAANQSGFHFGAGGGGSGLLGAATLAQAAQLQIPGVTLDANGGALGGGSSGDDTRAIAAVAVVVAIVGTVEAYVRLKAQAAGGDRIRMAQSIDDDAGLQVGVSRSIDQEEQALADCRARQVSDLGQHLAGASNESDRRDLSKDRSRLQGAIQQDVDLTGGLVDQQAQLAKTFTQGRAMSESRSEADVLGGQAPAYEATASTTPLQLPPSVVTPGTVTPVSNGGAQAATQAPIGGFVTARAAVVRSAPNAKGKRLKTLDAGVAVQPLKDPGDAAWVSLDAGDGATGYVRAADLTRSKGPVLAAPSNIREHNKAVIAARADGPDRLKSLLTDVQARHNRDPFHVLLAAIGVEGRAA